MVEGLIAMLLALIVIGGLVIYFGFTAQGFSQQEDTMTGSRDAQLILQWLRTDLSAADGYDASATSTTGTTFPKSAMHFVQSLASDRIVPYIHTRRAEPIVRPGDDPILDPMPPEVRTGSWLRLLGIPTDDPIFDHLPPGTATNDMLRRLNYAMNAATWVHPFQAESARWLAVNTRAGSTLQPASYRYLPALRRLERFGSNGVTLLGKDDVERFSVSPYFEFLIDPGSPSSTAELIRVWYEVAFTLRGAGNGAKIAKRALDFSTRITPKFLNGAIKSRWGQ